MSDQALTAEINQFLNDYNKAFAEVDGVAIARCYHAPSITMHGDASVHVLQTHQELETFFQAVAQKYFDDGGHNARFSDLTLQRIGSKSVLATLQWQQIRPDGSVLRSWRQSYNLIHADGRWQIFASTFHI
jgi:ketosteroid isomerase-like protein